MPFKRKIYDKLLEWKNETKGSRAILIEGARRIGKSTIVEEFAKNEYKSYILIDFSMPAPGTLELFDNIYDLNNFFFELSFIYHKTLHKRNSVIIFDEVQLYPKARQAIKHLVADGRYDYIETGSLITLKENVEKILIPSEERKLQMYPMDYEEFLWALGQEEHYELLRQAYERKKPLGNVAHKAEMKSFRLYMIIGGMPQAVDTYLKTNNLQEVDKVKRDILDLYEDDLRKIDTSGRLSKIVKNIPSQLASNYSYFRPKKAIQKDMNEETIFKLITKLESSKIALVCNRVSNPNVDLSDTALLEYYKLYLLDTGLFITLMFKDKDFIENSIYEKLLRDKLSTNLGYLFENAMAQTIKASGRELFYSYYRNKEAHRNYEIDYLISSNNKISPIEVKSGKKYSYASLIDFIKKYSKKVDQAYVFHTKDYEKKDDIEFVPIYLASFIVEK